MILIVTNKQDYTADFLVLELKRRGADYIRFNTEDFPERVQINWTIGSDVQKGYFLFPKRRVDFFGITSVWYRRPSLPIPSTKIGDPAAYEFAQAESQALFGGLWRCLECFWVSHPDALQKAEFKLYQLQTARNLGFSIPSTIVTNSIEEAQAFYDGHQGEIIYKPLRRGRLNRVDGVSLIFTNPVGADEARHFNSVKAAPSLFQTYIPKKFEVRVTVIGEQVFAVAIYSQNSPESRHDWRRGTTAALVHALHRLPDDVEAKCRELVQSMSLAFGAIDLILTPDGRYIFLEINPNGQWAWLQQLLPDLPLRERLADLLQRGEQ